MKNKRLIRLALLAISVWGLITLCLVFPWTRGVGDDFDFLLFHLQEKEPREDIVIVALDDETLNQEKFKRFQDITRADYARVLEHILKGNPKAIGVDTFFFNKSENEAEDERLREVLSQTNKVVVAEQFDDKSKTFIEPHFSLGLGDDDKGYVDLSSHSQADQGLITLVRMILDPGRVNSEGFREPFSLKMFRKLYPGSQNARYDMDRDIYNMTMGSVSWKIPFGQNWSLPINYYGGPGSYTQYSFYDVWDGFDDSVPMVDPSVFENKIVFIGATAQDIHDLHYTPTARLNPMAGVEIHAHLFQTIADRDFLKYSGNLEKWLITTLFIASTFALGWLFSFRKSLFVLCAISLVFVTFVVQIFIWKNVVMSFFWPLFGAWLLYLVLHIEKYLFAEQEKSWIKEAFGKYLSPVVVQKLVDHPEDISLAGEARDVTLWFSDIVGFTTVSEKLESPQVVSLLNTYHQQAASLLMEQDATIDKYLGDGTMAFWGAPLPIDNHAIKACLAAMLHRDCLIRANKSLEEQELPQIDVCIGLHSASVNVGNIGTKARMEYTAIGSGVNIASRIEGLNRVYGTHVLLSESTYEQVRHDVFVRELDTVQVKGSDKPMVIYELLCMKDDMTVEMEFKKQIYEQGLFAYRAGYWGTAKAHFYKLKKDKAAAVMCERADYFEAHNPGKDWDGVWKMTSK